MAVLFISLCKLYQSLQHPVPILGSYSTSGTCSYKISKTDTGAALIFVNFFNFHLQFKCLQKNIRFYRGAAPIFVNSLVLILFILGKSERNIQFIIFGCLIPSKVRQISGFAWRTSALSALILTRWSLQGQQLVWFHLKLYPIPC